MMILFTDDKIKKWSEEDYTRITKAVMKERIIEALDAIKYLQEIMSLKDRDLEELEKELKEYQENEENDQGFLE